jgi:uncharacterized membrane protein
MSVMVRHRVRANGWLVILVLTIALTALVGLCVFDRDHDGSDDHGVSVDLCLGMLVTSLLVVLSSGLVSSGWAVIYRLEPVPVVGLRVPAPPPKSTLRA